MEENSKGCDWFLAQAPKYAPQKINHTKFCGSEILFAQKEPSIIYLDGQSLEKIKITKKIIKTKLTDIPLPPAEIKKNTAEVSSKIRAQKLVEAPSKSLNFSYTVNIDEKENFTFASQAGEIQTPTINSLSNKFEHFRHKLDQALCCESTKQLNLDDEKLDDIMKSIATDPSFEELENDGESVEWIPSADSKNGLIIRTLLGDTSHFHPPVFLCESKCEKYQRLDLGELRNLGIQRNRIGHFLIGQEGTNASVMIFSTESTKPIKAFPKAMFATWLEQNYLQ